MGTAEREQRRSKYTKFKITIRENKWGRRKANF
jgi:hypothetical protein